jgi:hypothetical protein
VQRHRCRHVLFTRNCQRIGPVHWLRKAAFQVPSGLNDGAKTTATWLVRALVWTFSTFSVLVPHIYSQDAKQSAIRVDSTLVVVRAEVFDKKHMSHVSEKERECMSADEQSFYDLSLTQPYIPKACWGLVVRDLKASDFHLFVDGTEQKIQGFNLERSNILVRDTLGAHQEFSFTPTGKWSSLDRPRPRRTSVSVGTAENFFYFYNLAFVPEGAAGTACHEIRLKVDRPHTAVHYRHEYCAQQTPFDLLGGTNLGQYLERQIDSTEPGTLALLHQIGSFYTGNGRSRVWLSVEFAAELLRRHWEWDDNNWSLQASIGVLGIVRSHDSTEVMRFSDLGCCSDYSTARLFTTIGPSDSLPLSTEMIGIERVRIPIRYESQFDLPLGDYELRLALSDGVRVGRLQAELRIENRDGQALALSSVMLGKRVQDAHVAAEEMSSAENFAPRYVPMVSKGVQVAPTGNTRFKEDEQMFAYFEVYEPKLASSSLVVQAHFRISDATTREIKKDLGSVDAAPYINPGSTTIPIGRRIPFNTLAKGSYHLEVRVTDSSGQNTPWHSAAFTVD